MRRGRAEGVRGDVIRGCASRGEPNRERPRRRDRSVGAEQTNKKRESEREARAVEYCSGRADECQQRPSLDRLFARFGRALHRPNAEDTGGPGSLAPRTSALGMKLVSNQSSNGSTDQRQTGNLSE
jgi:hypothetical protein